MSNSSTWQNEPFLEKIELNHKVKLEKGQIYPFIDMSSVGVGRRTPEQVKYKEYRGSGVRFQKYDTLIAKIEPCLQNGKRFYFREGDIGFGSTEYNVFSPKDSSVDSAFLFYFLNQKRINKRFEAALTGTSGRRRMDTSFLASYSIFLPDIETQKNIASVLSSFDDKIEQNNKIIEMLEEHIQLIYDYWFMQFDFPDESGKPYRSSGGKMVWNDTLKQDIPKGWDIASLSDYLADMISGDWGKAEPTGNYTQRVYCIRGTDIISVDDLSVRYISKNHSHKFLLPNDIVIEVSGGSPIQATGRSTFISAPTLARYDSPLICANFCQVLRQKDDAYAGYFYRMWNKFYNAGIMFNYEGKTNGIKNLLVEAFCSIKWYFPPRELVVQFNAIAAPFISKLEQIKQEQKELTAQRDFLLPRMMNGQVMVE